MKHQKRSLFVFFFKHLFQLIIHVPKIVEVVTNVVKTTHLCKSFVFFKCLMNKDLNNNNNTFFFSTEIDYRVIIRNKMSRTFRKYL